MDLPRLGQLAPDFTCKAVLDDRVFDLSLSNYRNKYVVLLFFPINFTYVCPTELIAFSDHARQFRDLNTEVIGCSVESYFSHLKWLSIPHREGGIRGLKIPLIADKSMTITKRYGVLNDDEGIAYRAMFIIDTQGILRQITINDRSVGRSVPETMRLIRAFQHAEKLRETSSTKEFLEVTPSSIERTRSRTCPEKNLLRDLTE